MKYELILFQWEKRTSSKKEFMSMRYGQISLQWGKRTSSAKRIHEYEVWTNIVTEGEADFVRKKKLCT